MRPSVDNVTLSVILTWDLKLINFFNFVIFPYSSEIYFVHKIVRTGIGVLLIVFFALTKSLQKHSKCKRFSAHHTVSEFDRLLLLYFIYCLGMFSFAHWNQLHTCFDRQSEKFE